MDLLGLVLDMCCGDMRFDRGVEIRRLVARGVLPFVHLHQITCKYSTANPYTFEMVFSRPDFVVDARIVLASCMCPVPLLAHVIPHVL